MQKLPMPPDPLLRPVPFAPGYFAHPDGSVFSTLSYGNGTTGTRWRKMRPGRDGRGYLKLTLRIDGRDTTITLHKVIAITFHGDPPFADAEIRHLNGDRHDCRLANLQWGTSKEDAADRELHGTVRRGSAHARSKLNAEQVAEILASQSRRRDLAKQYGVSQYAIWSIKKRLTWAHLTTKEST